MDKYYCGFVFIYMKKFTLDISQWKNYIIGPKLATCQCTSLRMRGLDWLDGFEFWIFSTAIDDFENSEFKTWTIYCLTLCSVESALVCPNCHRRRQNQCIDFLSKYTLQFALVNLCTMQCELSAVHRPVYKVNTHTHSV